MLNFQQQISISEALLLNSIDLVSLKIHCLVSHCKMFCRKETLKVVKLKMIFFNFFQLQLCLIKIFNFHFQEEIISRDFNVSLGKDTTREIFSKIQRF